ERVYNPRLELAAVAARTSLPGLVDGLARLRLDFELSTMAPDLLRCIFGPDPYRAPPFDPGVLPWPVVDLARSLYEDPAFDRLAILGDALEEAGCAPEAAIRHCRDGGPHARGCWVVDLVLGKS